MHCVPQSFTYFVHENVRGCTVDHLYAIFVVKIELIIPDTAEIQ